MASIHPDMSYDDVLRTLTEQAIALWGKERANAVSSSLQATARQLVDINHLMPDRETEPGFYQ